MEKREINNREDVAVLVNTFYKAIRKDAFLGPYFTGMISNWETHLAHLTDFWCGQLFFDSGYEGDPMEKHRNVDKFFYHNMNENHFKAWLEIWLSVLDSEFKGENAELLKNKATKMASAIHMDMYMHRKKNEEAKD
ncbi:group III truncated hemoglobin [Pustulibacterium marinum]|nr:group III truncated hemoglobin [Pustulibacterium marinum]